MFLKLVGRGLHHAQNIYDKVVKVEREGERERGDLNLLGRES